MFPTPDFDDEVYPKPDNVIKPDLSIDILGSEISEANEGAPRETRRRLRGIGSIFATLHARPGAHGDDKRSINSI
jgi:hypothetical protein